MGLRERNAAKTRELILDTALTLFHEQGYEATKMEDIAERADIGTSTLYRYFPTKDQLLLAPLALQGQMAAELRARPPDEPLDLALGQALVALLDSPRVDPARQRRIREVIDSATGPRARLLEQFIAERTLLEQAVADRLSRPADDVFCVVTARLTTTVLELVGTRRDGGSDDAATAAREAIAVTRTILARLQSEPPTVPRLLE